MGDIDAQLAEAAYSLKSHLHSSTHGIAQINIFLDDWRCGLHSALLHVTTINS